MGGLSHKLLRRCSDCASRNKKQRIQPYGYDADDAGDCVVRPPSRGKKTLETSLADIFEKQNDVCCCHQYANEKPEHWQRSYGDVEPEM